MKQSRNPFLYLLSLLYGAGVGLRNFLFNQGILKEQSYQIPIICVGNITVGGTGKTPHVELLISILRSRHRIAVISRGYGRKSRGLCEVTLDSTVSEVGDEPKQIKLKYPEVRFIVDGNRRRAIRHLFSLAPQDRPDVILLDDGFQHRYVHPSFSILLVDASRELHEDALLPFGRLREPTTARYRADCIILTKCSADISPIQLRIMQRNLALYPHQQIFFSRIQYLAPRPLRSLCEADERTLSGGVQVLALSGVASPAPFLSYLREQYELVDELIYRDHHLFTSSDLQEIERAWREAQAKTPAMPLYVITTEKDAVRLADSYASLAEDFCSHLFFLPITTEILFKPECFQQMIHKVAVALPRSLQY